VFLSVFLTGKVALKGQILKTSGFHLFLKNLFVIKKATYKKNEKY